MPHQSDELGPREATRRMRELAEDFDREKAHVEADNILLARLRAHGERALCDLFERIEKWYA